MWMYVPIMLDELNGNDLSFSTLGTVLQECHSVVIWREYSISISYLC